MSVEATTGTTEEKNARGIPRAPFIVRAPTNQKNPDHLTHFTQANIEEYLGGPDGAVEVPLREFSAAIAYALSAISHFFLRAELISHGVKHRKYRFMEHNLTQRRQGLEGKIPDIKKTLSMVEFLHDRRASSF